MSSRVKDFGSGVRHLLRGFSFLASHPRLWIFAILPTAINLLLLAGMLAAFVHFYGDLYGWLSAHIGRPGIENPSTWYWHIAAALLWVVQLLMQVLIVVISLILLLLVSCAAGLVIAGPFNDALSERVEVIAAGYAPAPFTWRKFIAGIARVVRAEAIKAAILLAIPVALFALNLIPVVGGLAYVILTFLFGAWDLGFSYADIPNGRRAVPFRGRFAFARSHRWALIGLGAGFVIPFFGLLFAAPMVVGGTLLYLQTTSAGNTLLHATPPSDLRRPFFDDPKK